MNRKKGINTGGGTPKGVRKAKRRMTKETSGIAQTGCWDGFLDVKTACNRFLRERVDAGVMTEKQALPRFFSKAQKTSREIP